MKTLRAVPLVLATLLAVSVQAQPVVKLFGSHTGLGDWFGHHTAIEGDLVVVGAPRDLVTPYVLGRIYVFRYESQGWTELAWFTAIPPIPVGTGVGSAVGISGDWIIGGAPVETHTVWPHPSPNPTRNAGAAYVFRRQGAEWVQEVRLVPEGVGPGHYTGAAVALAAYGEGGLSAGVRSHNALVVFERQPDSTWTEQARLPVGWSMYGTHFGKTLTGSSTADGPYFVSAGASVYGAPFFRPGGSGWEVGQMLSGSAVGPYDAFGNAVAADGERVIVGAPFHPPDWPPPPGGSAYVFRYESGQWVEEARLLPGVPRVRFGQHVAISGRYAIVGSSGLGVLSFYRRHEDGQGGFYWQLVEEYPHPEGGLGDNLGGLSGLRAVAGRSHDPEMGDAAGAAYVFDLAQIVSTEPEVPQPVVRADLYPNPARQRVHLLIEPDRTERVRVHLSDVLGRRVAAVLDEVLAAGAPRRVEIETAHLAPGIYLVQVHGESFRQTLRLTVVR
jgi:hypothetical protein